MELKNINLTVLDNNGEMYDLEVEIFPTHILDLVEIDEDTTKKYGVFETELDGSWTKEQDEEVTELKVYKATATFENCNRVEFKESLDGNIHIIGDKLEVTLY